MAAQIFDNLVGRRSKFVRTLSQTGAMMAWPAIWGQVDSLNKIKREFDPGSESTLAARLTHASRTRKTQPTTGLESRLARA